MDGHQIPTNALQPDFTGGQASYVKRFMQMQNELGTLFCGYDNRINYKTFGNGSTVFVFDLTFNQSNGEHTYPTRCRSLRAEVRFGAPLENPITCFVHSVYANTIEIDQDRKVSVDYLV